MEVSESSQIRWWEAADLWTQSYDTCNRTISNFSGKDCVETRDQQVAGGYTEQVHVHFL